MTATGASHLHDDRSICRRETHRRIWFTHLFINRVESGAGAIRSRLSTRELNPDVRQPKTVSDSPLGRHGTSRGDTAVVHAHAAVHQNRVQIGLSIIQLKDCVGLLALIGCGATLDCRDGSFSRSLNLPDIVEKFGRGFWRRFCSVGHYALIGVAHLAIAPRVTERRRRIAGIGNPHPMKRDIESGFACGCRCHALTDRAHVAVDALNSLIRVLATR